MTVRVPPLTSGRPAASVMTAWCPVPAPPPGKLGRGRSKSKKHVKANARSSMSQRTLILVKPDGVERSIIGDVISRIERKGLKLVALELRTIDVETSHAHYAEH